ncbi:chloramphenicol acetyltransferase [Flavobacterium sp. NRK F10]|uniref:Chloramphenicol acetyltransferase n=1 Tax=Flavobacterium sediminis TaxID=2201181 RepID=A0A2U8QR65_9FLAO|nr:MULTISPECIES: chloramphenicol acetyltransferase [Flavobacterium]AWM12610.1 chloramphenicol acetyltransferase [Flavobacterium sediminis]MCO6173721.1 chloramphenicol acetyltransferase [Flavobacterium sp. NRK F10]
MKEIDIEKWNRKEHFEFFSKMVSPYFGVTTEVNCTKAFQKAKDNSISFFAYYMHQSIKAVNEIPEFKLRIIDDKVFELDTIHVGTTIGRKDGTFAFTFVNYSDNFESFNTNLQEEIDAVQNSSGLRLNGEDRKINLVRYSTLPWVSFSAILHPTNLNSKESVPKITFGKLSERNHEKFLPISIEAHHGLMDGFHIAQYLEKFQHFLNS